MAKKPGRKGALAPSSRCLGATLREETTGRKRINVSSMLRMEHLQKLATWAGGKASIPPLGAFFGQRMAASAEALGVPLDQSLFPCQRCETILQPGYNCTIRIEKKNVTKSKRHKKSFNPIQNNMVYTCHFCSHLNLKRGTPEGHMKKLFASRPSLTSEPEPPSCTDKRWSNSMKDTSANVDIHEHKNVKVGLTSLKKNVTARDIVIKDGPTTPLKKIGVDKKSKMSGSGSSKVAITGPSSAPAESGKGKGGSRKRKRKSWSSLREIAEGKEQESKFSISNLAIPFIM